MNQFYSATLTTLMLASSIQADETKTVPQTTEAKITPQVESKAQLTQRYSSPEKNYSIDYPDHWKKNDVPRLDLVLFIPPKGSEIETYASMNIVSEKVGPEITLSQFYTESTGNLSKSLKDVRVEKTGEADLNGATAKWILYTHEMKNISFRVLQYFIVSNDTVYLLTFSSSENSFDQYKQDFEMVANSFRILQKPKEVAKMPHLE